MTPPIKGKTRLFISHGAGSGRRDPDGPTVDWFIVNDGRTMTSMAGTPLTPEMAAESLRAAGRTVIELEAEPYDAERVTVTLSGLQLDAVLDGLSYFRMSDYGDGEMRPLDPERIETRKALDAAVETLDRAVERLP